MKEVSRIENREEIMKNQTNWEIVCGIIRDLTVVNCMEIIRCSGWQECE